MADAQPEALRLAQELTSYTPFDPGNWPCHEAAAELRRQHARIAELEAAQAETAQAAPVAGLLSAEQWLHEIHKAAMYSSHKNMGVWDEPLANMIAAAARQFSITATPGATHGN